MQPPALPAPSANLRRAVLGVAAAVAVLGPIVVLRAGDGGLAPVLRPAGTYGLAGAVLREPLPRPGFVLRDTDGRPYDFHGETTGEFTLLFFGYTSCPDFCPLQLAMLAQVLERPGVPQPTVVFVGIDPDRDTGPAVRRYLDRFDERFVGLVGTAAELRAAQEAAGVPPAVAQEVDPGEDALLGHGSQIIAYTPDDMAHVVYPYGIRQQAWVGDLERLATIEQWQGRRP